MGGAAVRPGARYRCHAQSAGRRGAVRGRSATAPCQRCEPSGRRQNRAVTGGRRQAWRPQRRPVVRSGPSAPAPRPAAAAARTPRLPVAVTGVAAPPTHELDAAARRAGDGRHRAGSVTCRDDCDVTRDPVTAGQMDTAATSTGTVTPAPAAGKAPQQTGGWCAARARPCWRRPVMGLCLQTLPAVSVLQAPGQERAPAIA